MLMNWVAALQPLTERKGWYWGVDGKFHIVHRSQNGDTPWLHAPTHIPGINEEGLDCGLLQVFHSQVTNKHGVHSFCMNCYKVVVMAETLEHVHKIADWQQAECTDNGWACKVGAERRNYTPRAWGAYFYCRGVEEGRERYKAVREWVDKNLGEDVGVILKRACTEFEQALGDSSVWEMLPDQEEIEREYKEILAYEPMTDGQAEAIKHHVWDVWDVWDADNQPPVTYHETEE